MRLMRARHENKVFLVRLDDDLAVVLAEESGHPAADVLREALARDADLSAPGLSVPAETLTALAPVRNPSKILCVGLNYAAHAAESGAGAPAQPIFFAKTTKNLIHGVADLVSYASRFATLEPGDLLFTGTPEGVGFARTPPVFLQNGDVVEVEIEGLGVLSNPVRTE